MTPEEAIRIIKEECYVSNLLDIDKTIFINTALDMAVEALKAEPCEDTITLTREAYSDLCLRAADYEARKAEPCEDCISRQAVIDTIETDCSWDIFNEWGSRTPTGECIINAIKSVPSVEPERKTGIWTHEDTGMWICGVCGEEVGEMGDEYGVPKYNFCPYCGADMTGRRWKNDK